MSAEAAPRVSVVIPSHDSAAFAEQAVASALAQRFGDFEVLVVDDGSGSEAAAKLEEIARDPKVRLLQQTHRGCRAARRHGWEQARGEYVAFLDDDDRYLEGYLERCVARLDGDSATGAVYTRYYNVTLSGDRERLLPERGYDGYCFEREVRKSTVKMSTLMVRRSALLRLRGILEHYSTGGDYDIVLRLSHAHRFAFIDAPLVAVTKRPGSLSSDLSRRDVNRAEILENLLRVFPQMSAAERRAVRAKTAKYYAKAGERALAAGFTSEASRIFRQGLATHWSARALRGYLRSSAATLARRP